MKVNVFSINSVFTLVLGFSMFVLMHPLAQTILKFFHHFDTKHYP